MDLSLSSREDPFAPESIFSKQDLPVVPNDNPESYCRLCLTTPDVEPLFPVGNDPNVYMLELIGKYIGIGLSLQEDYPCAVCRPCQLILDQFDLFRQNCLKVDIAIRRRRLGLDQVIKSEPLDENEEDESDLPYIRMENRNYKCRICSQVFRSLSMFMNHCKEEHPDESRMFKCKVCNKSFMTKTARLQHVRSHKPSNSQESDLTGDRIQVCEKCMVTFDSYKLLKIHIKDHHSNDPKQDTLVCITCNKQFSRITILRNHILRVHLGKLPHVCKQCGISFGYSQQLLIHLKHEHGIVLSRPDQPNQSGQSFTEEEFDNEEENPMLMPPTPEIVEEPPAATTPEPSPSKNKYTCIDCSMQCSSHDELRNHRKIHQDPTWWKCLHCRNFVKHQKMHLMKKHPTIPSSDDDMSASFQLRYRCWLCRVYFKSLEQMEVHANARHQIPLPRNHQPPQPDQSMSDDGEDIGEQSLVPLKEPTPLTVQPPLAIGPEHLPLLLSQLENGAWDYVKDISRFIDPTNLSAYSVKIKDDPDQSDTSANAVDLSGFCEQAASSRDVSFNSQHDLDPDELNENDSDDDYYVRLENRTYQCKFCMETFRHLLLIRKHVKTQHPTEWKSFRCATCKRRFPSETIRDRHAQFHSLEHPFNCTKCDQMYDSKRRLDQHFASYHDMSSPTFTLERLRCGPCRLMFTEKKYYDLHSRVYHDRKPTRLKNLTTKIQVCERCVITFNSRELLSEHMKQVHHNDPPLDKCECPRCAKDLKTLTLLRIHILVVHLGHLPFVCQYCDAAFSSRHWLLKHVEKDHTDQVTFKCPNCDESFNSERKLIQHQDQAHSQAQFEFDPVTGLALFPCTKCDKKFESKELQEKHVIKAHPTFMLLYKCPLCTKPIRYRRQHMRIHHDLEYEPSEHVYQTRYKCHCCSKLFKQKRLLNAHQNSLSFQCDRCQMRFKTKKSLLSHAAVHKTNNPLKCEDCGLEVAYRARLEEHRRRFHSSTSTEVLKLINCPYCPKLFMSMSNRERHISVQHPQDGFQIECNHCPLKVTDTTVLRKHYRTEHTAERCTFKCPVCAKVYLHASSYKTHFKQHKTGVRERREREKQQNAMASAEGGSGAKKKQQPMEVDAVKQEEDMDDEENELNQPAVDQCENELEKQVKQEPELVIDDTKMNNSPLAADEIKQENDEKIMSNETQANENGECKEQCNNAEPEQTEAEMDSARDKETSKLPSEAKLLETSPIEPKTVAEENSGEASKSEEQNVTEKDLANEREISKSPTEEKESVTDTATNEPKADDAEKTVDPEKTKEQNDSEKSSTGGGEVVELPEEEKDLNASPVKIEQKACIDENTDKAKITEEVAQQAAESPLPIPLEEVKTENAEPLETTNETESKQNETIEDRSENSKVTMEVADASSSNLDKVVQKIECNSKNAEIITEVEAKSLDTQVEPLQNATGKVTPAAENMETSNEESSGGSTEQNQVPPSEPNDDDLAEKSQTKDGKEEKNTDSATDTDPTPDKVAPSETAETEATASADDVEAPPTKKIKISESVDDTITDS